MSLLWLWSMWLADSLLGKGCAVIFTTRSPQRNAYCNCHNCGVYIQSTFFSLLFFPLWWEYVWLNRCSSYFYLKWVCITPHPGSDTSWTFSFCWYLCHYGSYNVWFFSLPFPSFTVSTIVHCILSSFFRSFVLWYFVQHKACQCSKQFVCTQHSEAIMQVPNG